MADQFRVVLDDLRALGDSFDREGKAMDSLKAKANQQAPDTGDGELTGALEDTLRCLSALYKVLADTVREHAGKLHATGDAYQATEESTRDLYDQLHKAFGSG
jgi:hypothetical protein